MRFSLAFIASALPYLVSAAPALTRRAEADILVFTFADVLEQLESQFYAQALEKFVDTDFTNAGFISAQLPLEQFGNILRDEQAHSVALQAALKSFGAEPVTSCSFDFTAALADVPTMLATARIVENVGVSAYLGGAALLTDPILLDAAGSILTIEARHQTILNILSAGTSVPSAFDIALTPSEILALAGPFISGCDLGIPANTPLTITNTDVPTTGTLLTFEASTLNGTVPNEQLFCQMIVGGASSSISLPISECVVPADVNGPVVIFITSDVQPLINNVVNRATDKIVAGPTVAFIDILPQLIGSLARGGSPAAAAPAASTTQIITPEAAQSIIDGASPTDAVVAPVASDAAAPVESVAESASESAAATATDSVAPEATAEAANNVATAGTPSQFTGPTQDGNINVNGWKTVAITPAKRSLRFSRR